MGGARRLRGPEGMQRGQSVSSEPAAVLTRPLLQPPLAQHKHLRRSHPATVTTALASSPPAVAARYANCVIKYSGRATLGSTARRSVKQPRSVSARASISTALPLVSRSVSISVASRARE